MSRWSRVAVAAFVLCVGVVAWLEARPYRRSRASPSLQSTVKAAVFHPPPAPVAAPLNSALPGTPSVVTVSQPVASSAASATATPPFEYTDNFLLVGLDRRAFGGGAGLADTIVVVVFDEPSGTLGLISVPRDLWVEIPGHGEDRINTVMNVARRAGEDPLSLLGRVLTNTLGLPIEHAVAIDLGVFERAIDALGGVTVDVPCPIIDRFIDPRDPSGHRLLDLPAGRVRLDGVTAAMYARSRHGRSDFSRARRQQAILLGMRRELTSPSALLRWPALFGQFEDSLETDLRRVEVFALARRVLRVDPRHVHGLVLGAEVTTPFQTEDGKAVLRPNQAAIALQLGKLFSAPSPGLPPAGSVCPKADIALSSG